MLSQTVDKYLTEISNNYDITNMKIRAVMEATARQFNINCAEAELKVMQENGTTDDLAYLYEEANENLITKATATIKKIIEAIRKFFKDLKDKIISLFTRKDVNENILKIEKKVKMFPLLGRKKVLIPDLDGIVKLRDETNAELNKIIAKAKGGQQVTEDDVDNVKKSFLEKHGKQIGIAAAITVTLSVALIILKKYMDNVGPIVADCDETALDICNQCDDAVSRGIISPKLGTKIAETASTVGKVSSETTVRGVNDTMHSVATSIRRSSNTVVDSKAMRKLTKVSESYDSWDDISISDSDIDFEEDVDDIFDDIMSDASNGYL